MRGPHSHRGVKVTKLEQLRKLCEAATPGPWKYDWGNWEVEGPRPDRYPICGLDSSARYHDADQAPNPVGAPADGEFIAAARTALPALLRVAQAAKVEALRFNESYCDRHECEQMTQAWAELDAALTALAELP